MGASLKASTVWDWGWGVREAEAQQETEQAGTEAVSAQAGILLWKFIRALPVGLPFEMILYISKAEVQQGDQNWPHTP